MKIPIVNESDEVIGEVEREERKPEQIIRITGIWVTDENGDILLQQRGLSKKQNPGLWGPAAAGTVEVGETYESNAIKELQEELGLTGFKLVKNKKNFKHSNTGKRFAQLFSVQIPRNTVLKIEEGTIEQVKWFTKEEIQKEVDDHPEKFVGSMLDLKGELF